MKNGNEFDGLKLCNQVCFPLYACAKEVVKRYKPYLDELDLTYTQYITMMVLWDKKTVNVKELGEKLCLDSGTLTPVLKNLEAKGYVRRYRSDRFFHYRSSVCQINLKNHIYKFTNLQILN